MNSAQVAKSFTFDQNPCSRYARISVHVPAECVFTLVQNTHPTSLVCIVDTPFGFGATGFLRSASFTNIDESFAVSIDVSEEARSLGLDYSLDSSRTLARWSLSGPVAAIPEPETYAMMLAGLGLLGAVSRRRKQKAAI